MKINIRLIYIYLFSAIGLIMTTIALVNSVDLLLRTVVFKNADTAYYAYPREVIPGENVTSEEKLLAEKENAELQALATKQREVSNAIAMVVIGLPLFKYHWRLAQKEKA